MHKLVTAAILAAFISTPALATGNYILGFTGFGDPVVHNGYHYPQVSITSGDAAVSGIVAGNINIAAGQLHGTTQEGTVSFIPAGYWGPSPVSQPLCYFFPKNQIPHGYMNVEGLGGWWSNTAYSCAKDANGNWEVTAKFEINDGLDAIYQFAFFCMPRGTAAAALPPALKSEDGF
jgi:hypothetical protein